MCHLCKRLLEGDEPLLEESLLEEERALGSARGDRAREWLAVDDLLWICLWHDTGFVGCETVTHAAVNRALCATIGGGSDACLHREWRVVEARLVAVSRGSSSSGGSLSVEGERTEPVPTAAKEGGASSARRRCLQLRAITGVVRCGRRHYDGVKSGKARCTLLEVVLMLNQALHKGRFFARG